MVGAKILVVDDDRPTRAGADAFFHKAFDYEELVGAIARALGRPA
jgi:DNA-binding response OmpR family regulator